MLKIEFFNPYNHQPVNQGQISIQSMAAEISMESAIIISGEPAELEPATAEDMQLVLGHAGDRKDIIKRFFNKQPSKFQLKMLAQAIKDEIIRRMDQENCLYPVAPEFIKKCLITKTRNAKAEKHDYSHFIDQTLKGWIALGSLKVYDPITKTGDVYMGLPADPLIRQTYGANYKFIRSDTTHLLFTSKGFSIVGLMSNTKFGVQIRDYFDMMQSAVVQAIPIMAAQNALLTPEQRAEVEAAAESKWQRLVNIERAKVALALEEKAAAVQALEEARVEAEQELEEERASSALAITNYPKDHFEDIEDAAITDYANLIKAATSEQHFLIIFLKKIYRRGNIFTNHMFKICTSSNPSRTLRAVKHEYVDAKLVLQVRIRDVRDFRKEIMTYLAAKHLRITELNSTGVMYHFKNKFGDGLQSILAKVLAIGHSHLAANALGQQLEKCMQISEAIQPFVDQMIDLTEDRGDNAELRMDFDRRLQEQMYQQHRDLVRLNNNTNRKFDLLFAGLAQHFDIEFSQDDEAGIVEAGIANIDEVNDIDADDIEADDADADDADADDADADDAEADDDQV